MTEEIGPFDPGPFYNKQEIRKVIYNLLCSFKAGPFYNKEEITSCIESCLTSGDMYYCDDTVIDNISNKIMEYLDEKRAKND